MRTVGFTEEDYAIEVSPIGELQKYVRDNGYEYEVRLNKREEESFLRDELKRTRGLGVKGALENVISRYEFCKLTSDEIFQIACEVLK
jgi:hypothetical protein